MNRFSRRATHPMQNVARSPWFAQDSPLEGGVSCEPVSESRKSALVSPYSGFDVFHFSPSNARVRAREGEAADHR
jgi:hypothetical protein